jgi:hypothetical protein
MVENWSEGKKTKLKIKGETLAVSIITQISGGLSILGGLIIILSFLFFKKLRESSQSRMVL